MIGQLLDLLIGLAFVYFLFSTLTSALAELLEIRFRRRALYLEQGIRELLGSVYQASDRSDGNLRALAQAFYDSPHISSLFRGAYPTIPHKEKETERTSTGLLAVLGSFLAAPLVRKSAEPALGQLKNLPSYIPAERFVNALGYLARDAEASLNDDLRTQFKRLREQICKVMGVDPAAGPEAEVAAISRYYQESMDRVSGWYRRWVGVWLLVLGAGVAGAFNVDTLELIRSLSQDAELREELVSRAVGLSDAGLERDGVQQCRDQAGTDLDAREQCVETVQQRIDAELGLIQDAGLPITWTAERWSRLWLPPERIATTACLQREGIGILAERACLLVEPLRQHWAALSKPAFFEKLVGVLLTALAISLGAPFWFDLLSELSAVRASVKPREGRKDTDPPAPVPTPVPTPVPAPPP